MTEANPDFKPLSFGGLYWLTGDVPGTVEALEGVHTPRCADIASISVSTLKLSDDIYTRHDKNGV